MVEHAVRSRRTSVVVGVASLVAAVLAAVVLVPRWLGSDDPSPAAALSNRQAAAPDELHVTCTDAGPEVDTTAVAAGPGGVVLVVDSALPEGSYLTYAAAGDGPAGGDVITDRPTTYAFPPGDLTLGCAVPPAMDETDTVTVAVVDPDGHWSERTLADFGCHVGSARASWVVGLHGTGATAQDAVDDFVRNARVVLDRPLTARHAEVGYADAARQTWVASETYGVLTFTVRREHGTYAALPEARCS